MFIDTNRKKNQKFKIVLMYQKSYIKIYGKFINIIILIYGLYELIPLNVLDEQHICLKSIKNI